MALLAPAGRSLSLALALAACGLGGADGGGASHLPTAGGGPYTKSRANPTTPAEEPYVVVDVAANLRDPAVLPAADGGFDLWFTRAPTAGGEVVIAYAHLPATTELPDVGPEPALEPAEDWEAGAVSAPSVVEHGDGRHVMYYQGGGDDAPSVGRAFSTDRGRTWTRDGLVLEGARDPSVVVVGAHTYLYFGLPDGSGIGLAEADGEGAFVVRPGPVLLPSSGPDREAFDRVWVGEPAAVGGKTSAGQLHIGLFYVGRSAEGLHSIGHAGSADGHTFMPFLGGEAVLDRDAPDERGPSAVLFADRGVLFFSQARSARTVIAVATAP